MALKQLTQIDQDLIHLLGRRIALVTQSKCANSLELPSDVVQLLAQSNVPPFIWEAIVTGCAAAATTTPLPTEPRQIAIVGGSGRMGCFFAQQLIAAGHSVRTLGRHDWNRADTILADADLVLISVPIQQAIAVVEQTAPYLMPTTALADLTGIKAAVVRAMLTYHSGPVLGLHPMFGPGIQSFLSQNLVLCPGRQLEAFQWLLDLIQHSGGNLVICTPEEHDRMMVMIQAIRHFSTFALGVFLAEAGIDIDRCLAFASPPFRLQLNLISRLFAQDASLYTEMMAGAEERRHAIIKLAATVERLAELIVQENNVALEQEFELTRNIFQPSSDRALTESNHVIQSLSVLLAADKRDGTNNSAD